MNRTNPSWQSFVPPSVSLYHVDYREDLDKHENLQEQCIRKKNLDAIREAVFDWYMEQERENLTQTIDEIEKKMSEDGRYEEFKEHAEEISDLIYERNDTDPTEDLIRHSTVTNFFYSLGVEIDGYNANGNTRGESEAMACYKIRRALKLKKGNTTMRFWSWFKTLRMVVNSASISMPCSISCLPTIRNPIFVRYVFTAM